MSTSSILPIDKIFSSVTTPGLSGTGSDGNAPKLYHYNYPKLQHYWSYTIRLFDVISGDYHRWKNNSTVLPISVRIEEFIPFASKRNWVTRVWNRLLRCRSLEHETRHHKDFFPGTNIKRNIYIYIYIYIYIKTERERGSKHIFS